MHLKAWSNEINPKFMIYNLFHEYLGTRLTIIFFKYFSKQSIFEVFVSF